MNPHTSTSLVESADSPSPHSGQDSGPSPSARSTSIARKSSPKTFWRTPHGFSKDGKSNGPSGNELGRQVNQLSTPTSSTSTEPDTEAATCSQGDFLANLSVLPGSDEARQMTVRSGRRCSALLAKRDPLGCLARTFLESSQWNSTTCYLTWKESATPAGRLLFRLVPSMPDTCAPESGSSDDLWATPNPPSGGRTMKAEDVIAKGKTANGKRQVDLANQVRVWPTPDAYPRGGPQDVEKRKAGGHSVNLQDAVAFPTPTSRDWKDNGQSPAELERNSTTLATIAGGSLNPRWVEWLMGYPLGWTALKDSETPSCRRSPTKSCEKSAN